MRMMGTRRPSPALVISLLALFVAMSATATGLPGRNNVDKNDLKRNVVKAKNIRKNAVRPKQLAPSATVKAEYSNGENINIAGNGANQTAQTVNIFVPRTGKLLINGGVRIDNGVGGDIYSCDFLLNGALMGASSRGSVTTNDVGATNDDNSCETSDAADVQRGNHTVELRTNGVAPGSEIEDASLQVLYVPNG